MLALTGAGALLSGELAVLVGVRQGLDLGPEFRVLLQELLGLVFGIRRWLGRFLGSQRRRGERGAEKNGLDDPHGLVVLCLVD